MLREQAESFKRQVDSSGGVIIPEEIRNQLNIKEGDVFGFTVEDNRVCLERHDKESGECKDIQEE